MTPQAAQFLGKASELLTQAETMLRVELHDACGRNAYLAGFHAAQAFLFERQGRIHKTHNGVRTEFARLSRHDPQLDADMRSFLARAYNLKAIADYETGAGSKVGADRAAQALEEGKRFVTAIAHLIADGAPPVIGDRPADD